MAVEGGHDQGLGPEPGTAQRGHGEKPGKQMGYIWDRYGIYIYMVYDMGYTSST